MFLVSDRIRGLAFYDLNFEKYVRSRQAGVGLLTNNYTIRAFSDEMREISREDYKLGVKMGLTLPLGGLELKMKKIEGSKSDFRELDFKFSRLLSTEELTLLSDLSICIYSYF